MVINLIAHPGAQVRVPVRGRVEQEQRPFRFWLCVSQASRWVRTCDSRPAPGHPGARPAGRPQTRPCAQGSIAGPGSGYGQFPAHSRAAGAARCCVLWDRRHRGLRGNRNSPARRRCPPHRPAQAGAEHRQRRKPGPTAGRISPGRLFRSRRSRRARPRRRQGYGTAGRPTRRSNASAGRSASTTALRPVSRPCPVLKKERRRPSMKISVKPGV